MGNEGKRAGLKLKKNAKQVINRNYGFKLTWRREAEWVPRDDD